jgi:hypothetical protein
MSGTMQIVAASGSPSSANKTEALPLYMILGHGNETMQPFESRFILPENTYVVLFTTVGNSIYTDATDKYQALFQTKEGVHKLHNPYDYADELESELNNIENTEVVENISMRIYGPGDRIPTITTDLTTTWNHKMSSNKCGGIPVLTSPAPVYETFVCMEFMKSGIYKIEPGQTLPPETMKLDLQKLQKIKQNYLSIMSNAKGLLGETEAIIEQNDFNGKQNDYLATFHLYHRHTTPDTKIVVDYLKNTLIHMTDMIFRDSLIKMDMVNELQIRIMDKTPVAVNDPRVYKGYDYQTSIRYTLEALVSKFGEGIYYFDGCRAVKGLDTMDTYLSSIFKLMKGYIQFQFIYPNNTANVSASQAQPPNLKNQHIQWRPTFLSIMNSLKDEEKADLNLEKFKDNIINAYLNTTNLTPASYKKLIKPLSYVYLFMFQYHFVKKKEAVNPSANRTMGALLDLWKKYRDLQNNPDILLYRHINYESDTQQTANRNMRRLKKQCTSLICGESLSPIEEEKSEEDILAPNAKKQRTKGGTSRRNKAKQR